MAAGRSIHRYPRNAVASALFRAAAGMAITAGVLILTVFATVALVLLVPAFALFLIYGIRALIKGSAVYSCDAERLERIQPRSRCIMWKELTELHLAYYTTRRDGEDGWMELRLCDQHGRMTLESELEGFSRIAAQALKAARSNGVALSSTTERNLAALLDGVGNGSAGQTDLACTRP